MAVVSGTIMTLKILGKMAAKKLTMTAAKGMAKKAVKKAVKSKVKKAIKSKLKRKRLKGKDIAQKMLGGGEEGGSLVVSPVKSLVSAPGGAVVEAPSEKGGELVATKSSAARELGLEPFMSSLTSIQTNVDAIKASLNENNKDTQDRIEDQRILNNRLNKEEREAELEGKGGLKDKLLKPGKDIAEGFLSKMARFFTSVLLGSLINALLGGVKDLIFIFRVSIEALKKGMPALLKGAKALKAGIGKSLKLIVKPFKSIGRLIGNIFISIGQKITGIIGKAFKWADDAVKAIVNATTKAFPNIANALSKGKKFAGNVLNRGKDFVKGAVSNVGSKIKSFLPGGGKTGSKILKHGLKRGANRLIVKWFGKGAAKTLATVGKTLVKGAKAIKIPVIGPLLVAVTSMFAGDPMSQTLFKTMGAAIGGGLGLFLGPIGMIVGEIVGEFIGDVLYTGFNGDAGGWAAAGKKLKDKFMQIVKGGKVVLDWIGGGFSRFFKGFMEEHSFELPWWVSGPIKKLTGLEIGKLPNILQLYNPMAMGPLLLKSFFPPGGKKEKSGDTEAKIGEKELKDDAKDVSESASYEDGAEEDTTVVVDGGGDQAAAPASSGGGTQFIPVGVDKLTLVNSQYELQSTAALYKV